MPKPPPHAPDLRAAPGSGGAEASLAQYVRRMAAPSFVLVHSPLVGRAIGGSAPTAKTRRTRRPELLSLAGVHRNPFPCRHPLAHNHAG